MEVSESTTGCSGYAPAPISQQQEPEDGSHSNAPLPVMHAQLARARNRVGVQAGS
jgi:hypothetical protein